MLAYRLREPIEIWERVKGKNSIGSITETETLIETVWADMQVSTGKVVSNNDRVIHTTDSVFIMRNYPIITYNHFIKAKGEKYTVTSIQPLADKSGQKINAVRNG